jgi:hypothetical protein
MNNHYQVFIVKPSFSYLEIEAVLKRMGWQRDGFDLGTQPLIANEPEVMTWSWTGRKPYIVYTFNPVVKMRVLDVAGLPPAMRAALANELPLLDAGAIANLFESDDIRERLLGLWAAQETERVDLIKAAQVLTHDREPALAEQAKSVCAKLERIDQARMEVLVQMKIMSEAAPQLIRQLNNPQFVQQLRPSREDLQALFDEELVDAAHSAITQLYSQPLAIQVPQDAELIVSACPAGLLRWPNMLSDKFPGGYQDMAGWMNPSRIWICWTQKQPGTSVTYDGLVWLDDHWCWLPKIFRAIGPYLFSGLAGTTRH